MYVFTLIQLACSNLYGFSVSARGVKWVWSLCLGRHQCSARAYTCVQYCVCYRVQGGSWSVCVYTNSISPSIVVAFLKMQREFSECGRCSHLALCFSQCKVRSSTLRV